MASETPPVVSRRAFASDRALDGLGESSAMRGAIATQNTPRSLLLAQGYMMHLTIDASDVTELRRRVIGTCGELIVFMRIQPLRHASKMRVWILLKEQEFDFVKQTIRRGLPGVEFEQPAEI